MTVPATTYEVTDTTTSGGFTMTGSPLEVRDYYGNLGTCFNADNTNDGSTKAFQTGMITAGATKGAIHFPMIVWGYPSSGSGAYDYLCGQTNTNNANSAWDVFFVDNAGTVELNFVVMTGLGNASAQVLATAIPQGRWVWLGLIFELDGVASSLKVTVDGVEVSYIARTNHASSVNASSDFDVSAFDNTVLFGQGIVSPKIKFWNNVTVTVANLLEDFQNESSSFPPAFIGAEDHLYSCSDAAAQLTDSVGGYNLTSGNLPDFNTPTAGKAHFKVAGSDWVQYGSNPISDTRGDISAYFILALPSVVVGTRRIFRPTYADASAPGPWVSTIGTGTNLVFDIYAHAAGSGASLSLDTGVAVGDVDDSIQWGIAFAYNRSTKTLVGRVRSSTGVSVSGSNVGTVHAGFTAGNGHIFAATPGPVNPMEMILDEAGFKNGIAYTSDQLLTALNGFFNTDPALDTSLPDDTLQVGQTLTINLDDYFSDADSDPLTYTGTRNGGAFPSGWSIAGSTLTILAAPAQLGSNTVAISADDGGGGTPATDSFVLTVVNPEFPLYPIGGQGRADLRRERKAQSRWHRGIPRF